ncbi:MAG: methionyl-tRNA formyltransferase [Desulfobacterales bacterium]
MGTPDFAIPSLVKLHERSHHVVGVVTAPDKPVGRGLKVKFTPVKNAARALNLPVYQPKNLNDSEFIETLRKTGSELFVVVAFRILPEHIFEIPAKGTINLHASLLPKYRGAAPINWALINGESETGVTTIFIQEKVDTGDILLQKKVPITPEDNCQTLHDKLAEIGAEILLQTVEQIQNGTYRRIQQTGPATRAPKLTKELARIHWHEPNFKIHNLVRGLSPVPAAHTFFNGKLIKILKSQISTFNSSAGTPGEIVYVNKKQGQLIVSTGSGFLEILELQPAGKKSMTASAYLAGHKLQEGERFE